MAERLPDAQVRLFWDSRRKRWAVTVWTRGEGVATGVAHTTAPMDAAGKHLLLKAVVAEMESWLA